MNFLTLKLYDFAKYDFKLSDVKAKEFVDIIKESLKPDNSLTANKQDIFELKLEIERTKSELYKWFLGSVILIVVMILGLYATIILKK